MLFESYYRNKVIESWQNDKENSKHEFRQALQNNIEHIQSIKSYSAVIKGKFRQLLKST